VGDIARAGGNGRETTPIMLSGQMGVLFDDLLILPARVKSVDCLFSMANLNADAQTPSGSLPWETPVKCFGAGGQIPDAIRISRKKPLPQYDASYKKWIQSNTMIQKTVTLCRCSRDALSVRCWTTNCDRLVSLPVWTPVVAELCSSLVLMGITRCINFERCMNCRLLLSIISLSPAAVPQPLLIAALPLSTISG